MVAPADDLRGAVARGEIGALFQPQMDTSTNRIVAAEALSRWRHPRLGSIEPAVFIPVAESMGLIDEIGLFMIDEACGCAAAFRDHGFPLEISVNVSAHQFAAPGLVEHLRRRLDALALDPRFITAEITESHSISDVPGGDERLAELRALGVGLSIDDFGTGYSSVGQLSIVPATELKIDRSLVHREDEVATALTAAAVELAHEMGMRVVAEGVETETQLRRIRDLGCDRAQGYLVGRAVTASALEARVAEERTDR